MEPTYDEGDMEHFEQMLVLKPPGKSLKSMGIGGSLEGRSCKIPQDTVFSSLERSALPPISHKIIKELPKMTNEIRLVFETFSKGKVLVLFSSQANATISSVTISGGLLDDDV